MQVRGGILVRSEGSFAARRPLQVLTHPCNTQGTQGTPSEYPEYGSGRMTHAPCGWVLGVLTGVLRATGLGVLGVLTRSTHRSTHQPEYYSVQVVLVDDSSADANIAPITKVRSDTILCARRGYSEYPSMSTPSTPCGYSEHSMWVPPISKVRSDTRARPDKRPGDVYTYPFYAKGV